MAEETAPPTDDAGGDAGGSKLGLFSRLKQSFRHPNKTAVIGVVVAILTLVVGIMMYRRMQGSSSSDSNAAASPTSITPADAGGGGPDLSGLLDAIKSLGSAGGPATPQPTADSNMPSLPIFDTSGSNAFGAAPVFSTSGSSNGGSGGDTGGGYTPPLPTIPTFHVPGLSDVLSNIFRGAQMLTDTGVPGRVFNAEKNIGQQLIAQPQEAARNFLNLGDKAAVNELQFGKRVVSTEQNVAKQIVAQPAEIFHNTQAGAGYITGQIASAEHSALYNAPVIGGLLQRIVPQPKPAAPSTGGTGALRIAAASIPKPPPMPTSAPVLNQYNPVSAYGRGN